MKVEALKQAFSKVYHEKPTGCYFSPGRINLIGEHTDYNGGHVFRVPFLWASMVLRVRVRIKSSVFIRLILKNKA